MADNKNSIRWQRAGLVRIYDVSDRTRIIAKDNSVHELKGDSAELLRAVLAMLTSDPLSKTEILGELAELTGAPIDHPEVIDDLLARLSDWGVIEVAKAAPKRSGVRPDGARNIVVGISGAIAAAHAPALVLELQRRGHHVRVVMTQAAQRFVSPRTLTALTHDKAKTSLWSGRERAPVAHLELAEWADAVLIYPASATTIHRLASGDFSELVAATALSTEAPVVLTPSMNPKMLSAAPVRRNLDQLVEDGFFVLHPAMGVEVAESPDARAPLVGPAPPVGMVIAMLERILSESSRVSRRVWEEAWSEGRADLRPWDVPLELELEEAISRYAKPGAMMLDVGTGSGRAARLGSDLGMIVVGTDLSENALAHAREESPQHTICWLLDNFLETRLFASFELLFDRGLLHSLGPSERRRYVSSAKRLVKVGGTLIVSSHLPSEGNVLDTARMESDEISSLFSPAFELVDAEPMQFSLRGGTSVPAIRSILRRV